MEDLGYLLDLAGLYRKMALKITKFLWTLGLWLFIYILENEFFYFI